MPRRQDNGEMPGLVAADSGDMTAHRQIAHALDNARAAGDPAQTAMLAAALLIEGHVRSNFRDFPRLIADTAPVRDAAYPWRSADDELLVLSGLLAGLVYFGNDDPFLPTCVERLLALVEQDLDVNRRFAAGRLLLYYSEPRELRVLSQRVYSVLAPARNNPRLTPHRLAHFLIYWTRAARYAKEARQARQAEADVRALVARHGLADIRRGLSYLDVARSLPGGDVGAVRRAVAGYEAMVDDASLIDLQRLEYLKTKLAGLEGRLDGAVFHATRATEYARELAFPPPVLAVYIVSEGQAHLALGVFDTALRLLREAVSMVPARFVDEIDDMIAFVEAWSLLQRGERDTGLAHFRAAWRRVRERQFYDTFDGLPAFGARLCALALEQGIEVDFVRSLVQTCGIAPPPDAPESWPWPVRIRALGGFVVELQGSVLAFEGKAQKKPLEFLKVLIALGGRAVPKERLQDLLWPDADAATSASALDVLISRTRKLLGDATALRVDEGKVGFESARVWLDVWAFDADVESLQRILREPERADDVAALASRLVERYRGRFLGNEDPQRWSLPARDRWQSRLRRSLADAGRHCEEHGDVDGAIALYDRALEEDNLAEDLYRRLMRAWIARGEPAEAARVYRRCREMLSVQLGIPPSADTEALFRSLYAG